MFIYHENKTNVTYSDEEGVADISKFPKGLIFVQHPAYYEKSVAYLGSELDLELKEKIVAFNEVVISANKWEQDEERIAQQIMSIRKKSIDFQNPQTSADLLSGTGQVFVQKSQLGGGSPKLRGFAANAVLLVVDGVRMNNAIFRSGNLQNIINIDPNAIQSSEVIFGPGSVIYGSDAMGGVMDFHTIDPNWSATGKTSISGNFLSRYSTAANEKTGHVDLAVAKDVFTFFHSTTYTSLDDLKAGSNRSKRYQDEFERTFFVQRINDQDQLVSNRDVDLQKFSGYNLFNTINKFKFRLKEVADLSYGFYYSTTSDIPRYDNLTETIGGGSDSLASAEWYYGPQDWQMHNVKLNLYLKNPLFDQARATLAYQKFEESRNDRDFGDDRLRTRTEQVDLYTASLDFDKALGKSNFYYGIDFFYNDVSSTGIRKNIITGSITPTSSRYPDGGSVHRTFAAYTTSVNNLTNQLVLSAGLRFSSVTLEAVTNDSTANSNNASRIDLNNASLNGSLGLAAKLNEKNKLSYNLSSGFRSPNVDDVGKVFDIGNSLVVPNPSLRPERSLSNEISYEFKNDRTQVKVVTFYSWLFDAIVEGDFALNGNESIVFEGDTLGVFAKINTGNAQIYGASLVIRTELSRDFALENVISFVEGEDIANDQPLRHTTPIFGRTTLIHRIKKFRSEFFVEFNGNRNRSQIPSSEIDRKPYLYTSSGSPGWYTLNFKSSYQINTHFRTHFGIENILDTHYRPYTSGISAPGRNFIISLRATI
ncbi:MAG: TonB-dependent receptor [Bacteroidota bacterium]